MAAANYYVNDRGQSTSTGEHEVHAEWCIFLPLIVSKTYLGVFTSSDDALAKAKTIYRNSDGCATCCPLSHHR